MQKSKLKIIVSQCKGSLLAVGLFSCFVNLFQLTIPLYMLQVFDRVLASQSYDTLIFLTMISIFSLIIMGVLDAIRSKVLIKVSHWLDNHLSSEAFLECSQSVLEGSPSNPEPMKDVNTVRDFLCGQGVLSVFDAPWTIIYIFVIFLLNPILGVIASIGVCLLAVVSLINQLMTRSATAEAKKASALTNAYVSATLANAEAVHSMGMFNAILRKWFSKNETMMQYQCIASSRSAGFKSLAKSLQMILQLSILGVGAALVVANQFTPGAMIAASILMGRALGPVVAVIASWGHIMMAKQSYARLDDYLKHYDELTVAPFLTDPKGHIKTEALYFKPTGAEQPVIKGVNMELMPGEVLAIMGPSGAGKSTLLRLLIGIFKPTHGHVILDGCDVAHCDRHELGQHIGYCPQDIQLLPGTIRDNIARMGEGSDDRVIEAATFAGVNDLILQFPKGYHTRVSQFELSGGQKQRIALARAYYNNPCLVVLDEPSSNLDQDGIASLMQSILDAKQRGISVVLVVHQASYLRHADKVMILQNGMVKAYGSYDQVFKSVEPTADQPKSS